MIIDKITNRLLEFLIRKHPGFVDYLVEKMFFTFKYIPNFFSNSKNFEKWEKLGFHITEAHFYQPIPELLKLDKKIWQEESPLHAITISKDKQIDYVKLLVDTFNLEFNTFNYDQPVIFEPWEYYTNNNNFTSIDGEVYYSIIRNKQPNLIIEIGSGFSSFIAYKALKVNNKGKLICIEPYPREFFINNQPTEVDFLQKKLEEINIDFFKQLKENDILFIDSTHVLKLGSDVAYLFFNILPILNSGVIIHIHDVFYPYHYPEVWAKVNRYFWNEQYVLQAFLMYNNTFNILLCNSLLNSWIPEYLKSNIASYRKEKENPGSIWLEKLT